MLFRRIHEEARFCLMTRHSIMRGITHEEVMHSALEQEVTFFRLRVGKVN